MGSALCVILVFAMATETIEKTQALKTSEVYPLDEPLPNRFENPAIQKGYPEIKKVDKSVLYRTTNATYGGIKPCAYDMPLQYQPRTQKFSDHIAKCGGVDQWRAKGLNTSVRQAYITGNVTANNKPLRNKMIRHPAITTGTLKLTDD